MFNIDQTFSFGQANNARMQSSNLMEAEALKEPCPTCGAIPGKRCELFRRRSSQTIFIWIGD